MPKDLETNIHIEMTEGQPVTLPEGVSIATASFMRDGDDLTLSTTDGQTIVIEDYFQQNPAADLLGQNGTRLSPEMVEAFLPPVHVGQYAEANNGTMTDVSPVGQITEIIGEVTIIRADGTKVTAVVGTPVYQGDIVETVADGAANILFADNTTFSISEDARLSVDQFTYSGEDQSGSSFFSMLKGMFVYTSGMIGKNDPGNVNIETPVGSIGIRGTVVAGKIDPDGGDSSVTIIDGAIVLTNAAGTVELNDSFETASLTSYDQQPQNIGQISATQFTQDYSTLSGVSGDTFSQYSGDSTATSDSANENTSSDSEQNQEQQTAPDDAPASDDDGANNTTTDSTTQNMTADAGETLPPPPPPPSSDTTLSGTTTQNESLTTTTSDTQTITTTDGTKTTTRLNTTTETTQNGETIGTVTGTEPTFVPPNPIFDSPVLRPVREFMEPGTIVARARANDPDGVTYNLITNATSNTITVPLNQATAAEIDGANPTATINPFVIDPNTGVIRLSGNPTDMAAFALNHGANPTINLTVEAKDSLGNISTQNITLNVPDMLAGTVNPNGRWMGTPGDDAGGGPVTSGELNKSEILIGLGGNDLIFGGGGNDTILAGPGNDSIVVGDGTFRYIDGGSQIGDEDKLILGDGAAGRTPITLDFHVHPALANKINNIDVIDLGDGSTNAATIKLSVADVFKITDGDDHTLVLNNSATGYTSNVFTDIDEWTGSTGILGAGNGNLTLVGVHDGQTVTLVIEQGTGSNFVQVTDV